MRSIKIATISILGAAAVSLYAAPSRSLHVLAAGAGNHDSEIGASVHFAPLGLIVPAGSTHSFAARGDDGQVGDLDDGQMGDNDGDNDNNDDNNDDGDSDNNNGDN